MPGNDHNQTQIDFQTSPERYKHWRLDVAGPLATLTMDIDENAGLFGDVKLKLNSYDLGVDIELNDVIQRLRFEHPSVKTVVIRSGKPRVFCSGANIRMLASATHAHKVNFCKFTNETRNAMEEAGEHSGQLYIAAIQGACAGGGYELALASDWIILVDDGTSSVSLPEVALLAVLPGTGGLTRLTDKRLVRRDRADVFCTLEEGIKGRRALDWNLVDELAPASQFDTRVAARAAALSDRSDRPSTAHGIKLTPITRAIHDDLISYSTLVVRIDREAAMAKLTIQGPGNGTAAAQLELDAQAIQRQGASFWPLRLCRELEDAILHLRSNEPEIGLIVFETEARDVSDTDTIMALDRALRRHAEQWLVREIRLYWKRTLKRLDVTSRTLVSLIGPGSCFAGFLNELVLACDRSYMLEGQLEGDERPAPTLVLSQSNFADFPMANGLSRLQTRLLGEPDTLRHAKQAIGDPLSAKRCESLGLVTFAFDELDWEEEIRIFLEERASFSPDALTGLEANLRFPGPESMETKIFARLSAWQNWIFQRPSAVGPEGALKRYGTGERARYDHKRN